MITIQIDGKTYTVAREKMGVYHKLQQFINVGYLEEVKENKEPSILKKLREWEQEERSDALSPLVKNLLDRLSVLLTSLEKQNTQHAN